MSKVMSMRDAISGYVKSGDLVFIGGMQHGEPFAAVHEILRQKLDRLTLVSCLTMSPSMLIGEGRVERILTGYYGQDFNRSYWLHRAKSIGKYPVFQEYSHFGIAQALLAGQIGISYIPIRSMVGSDMLQYNPNIKITEDPFTGKKIGAVKAIVPDVGIIHTQRCDAEGNAQRWGTMGVDVEGINASRTVIVTTEKIVDSDVIRRDPNRTVIPGYRVSAVVEASWGAHPMHFAGCYSGNWPEWLGEIGSEDGYNNFMEKFVYGVSNWDEFMALRRAEKGEAFFDKLKIKAVASDPIYSGLEEGA
jgi:glutaconate CoA-transferase subunit A